MRALMVLLVVGASAPAWAQYAPNATGLALQGAPGSDVLRIDGQPGIGLDGTRQIGIGHWSFAYRGVLGFTTAIDDASRATLLPVWVQTGLRYDLMQDRSRPFALIGGTYYQLTNVPAGFTGGTTLVGPLLRLGFEQYIATEMSVQLDCGGSWLVQLNADDALVADAALTLKVHY